MASFSDFAGFRQDLAIITVHGSSESLLRAFWEIKINVDGILGKKMPELKEIKTLGRSIEKIETLMAKLKITTNFKGVNSTFPVK